MSDLNVLDQLKRLVELQKDDAELYELRRGLEEKPILIDQLEKEFESKKSWFHQLEENFKKIQLERNSLEGDLDEKEAGIKKAESHLSMIKTNKEYTVKIGEIEGIRADKSIIEEKILESYDKADEVKTKIDEEKNTLAKEETDFNEKKQVIEAEIKDLNVKLKEFNELRSTLLEGVDKDLLNRYDRILSSREGLAVVPVLGNVCGGCFINLPTQLCDDLSKHKEIISCEMCTRILYLEEDLNKVEVVESAVKQDAVESSAAVEESVVEEAAVEVPVAEEIVKEEKKEESNSEAA